MDHEAELKRLVEKGKKRRQQFGAPPPSIDRMKTLPYEAAQPAWLISIFVEVPHINAIHFIAGWKVLESMRKVTLFYQALACC